MRKGSDRGRTRVSWLDSRHSFAFGEYYDPQHLHFRSLRVINDDVVQPGAGFGTHPHRDMEILTYVVSGKLEHRDSMGNGGVIEAGELQAMSAGRGVTHSEFNPSKEEPAHFLQIWITPKSPGLPPSYAEWKPNGTALQSLTLLASHNGSDGSVTINQEARVFLGTMKAMAAEDYSIPKEHGLWLQMMEGELLVDHQMLKPGDAMSVENEKELKIKASQDSRFLLFDLA